MLIRQSTATTVLVGPVMDSTGAAVVAAVIGDFNLTKNGATAAMAAPATATHSHNGHYLVTLTTGNSDTLGQVDVTVNNTNYAMPPASYIVLAPASYDEFVTGVLASPRRLDTVADNQMTVSDSRWASIVEAVGRRTKSGVSLTYQTPAGTTARSFTLDNANTPSSRT